MSFTDEQKRDLRIAMIDALAEVHVCSKEEEIAELKASAKQMGVFAHEVKETQKSIVTAMSALAKGAERLHNLEEDLRDLKTDTKEKFDKVDKRLVSIGEKVEHVHAPVIAEVQGVRKFTVGLIAAVLAAALIGFGIWNMNMFAEHRIATEHQQADEAEEYQ